MGWSKQKDTFILMRPVDYCTNRRVVLHDLIYRYGGDLWDAWRNDSWTTTYEENWFPTQNKVAYKDREPRKKKTFKDKQKLKSAALEIKIRNENADLGCVTPSQNSV